MQEFGDLPQTCGFLAGNLWETIAGILREVLLETCGKLLREFLLEPCGKFLREVLTEVFAGDLRKVLQGFSWRLLREFGDLPQTCGFFGWILVGDCGSFCWRFVGNFCESFCWRLVDLRKDFQGLSWTLVGDACGGLWEVLTGVFAGDFRKGFAGF